MSWQDDLRAQRQLDAAREKEAEELAKQRSQVLRKFWAGLLAANARLAPDLRLPVGSAALWYRESGYEDQNWNRMTEFCGPLFWYDDQTLRDDCVIETTKPGARVVLTANMGGFFTIGVNQKGDGLEASASQRDYDQGPTDARHEGPYPIGVGDLDTLLRNLCNNRRGIALLEGLSKRKRRGWFW
jgi:hypothetical protein